MKRIAVLLSGRGSNFISIHNAMLRNEIPGAEISLVLSNKPDAPGLATARQRGLVSIAIASSGMTREEHDAAVIAELQRANVDLVVLAGYMRLLTPAFIAAFRNRILNIHPSLLPAFPGLHAQQQAFDYGARFAGCTVHFVDEKMDHGIIILQRAIEVLDTDDADTLAARILDQEHIAYPEALRRVLSDGYRIEGRRYVKMRESHPPPFASEGK